MEKKLIQLKNLLKAMEQSIASGHFPTQEGGAIVRTLILSFMKIYTIFENVYNC